MSIRNAMKTLKISIIILFQTFLFTVGNAQTKRTVEDMAKSHQDCLDTGIDMLGCSKHYYFQMDSMLNVVYDKYRATLNNAQKAVLKKEQLNWIKKRDIYFKKQNKEFQHKFKSGEWGTDMAMITYDNNAEFVKDRVIVLLRKLRKD